MGGTTTYEQERVRTLRQYGLTPAAYDSMLAGQGGVCAICRQAETRIDTRTGTAFVLAVDHDHETRVVRGLLCNRCNRAVGMLNDDPDLVQRAAVYLIEAAPTSSSSPE